jgi:hypothetical protein
MIHRYFFIDEYPFNDAATRHLLCGSQAMIFFRAQPVALIRDDTEVTPVFISR